MFDDLYLYLVEKESKKIGLISAVKYTNSIQECINIKKDIEMSLITEFKGAKLSSEEYKSHALDESGKSKFFSTKFSVSSKDDIIINCYDWSIEAINKHGWKKLLVVQIKLPDNETIPHEEKYGKFMYEKLLFKVNKKNFTLDEKYYALLIGNSNYLKSSGWGPLISPTNDITEIAKVLRTNYDFADVKVIKDVTRDKLFKTLRNYQKIITPNDYFLIYYAGHGDQDANQAYWIPVNAGKEWDENWIDTLTIKAAISRIKTKHTLLMIDSCYVGTSLKGNDNNVSKNYKVSTKLVEKGLLNRAGIVISSGSTSSVLDTAIDDKHSPFAYKFIDLLKKNTSFITSTKLYSELVEYHEDFKQTPQRYTVKEWGHLDGDFVFIRK